MAFLSITGTVFANPTLLTHASIISFDTGSLRTKVLHDSSLLVQDGRIAQIYDGITPSAYPEGTDVVNATGKIITPGFIDTHHHLWQTAFKSIASNATLTQYLQRYGEMGPSIQHFTAEDKYLGQLAGALELLNGGVTTVLDHAHGISSNETADALFNATIDSGLRAFYAFVVHDLNLPNFTLQDQIYKLIETSKDPRLSSDSVVQLALGYDSFTMLPAAFTQRLRDIVQSQNISLVTTHYLGSPWPTLFANSPTLLHSLGWLNTTVPVIFSHATAPTPSDLLLLRQTNQYISTTPESEFHSGQGNKYAHLIQDQASLGADTHFAYSTDMIGQARMWLQNLRRRAVDEVLADLKVARNNPMSVEQAFHLITRGGALALRRPDLGILAPGAKADLVVFSGDSPNMLGWSDAVAAIILHSNVGDVEGVMVGGQWVKKGGRLMYKDYEGVKKKFGDSARRIQSVWGEMDWGAPDEGLFMGEVERGTATVVDTRRGEGTGY
ncbi:Metallo-dependent hydrolase [Amniculicola lignicola CBS 123094]|uniref:Metallo-dependent hydrolase n=1 Tax=Amniculicola lignicola CBS 123094 TaxID=1392246 RepID=A0A6A5VVJ0_9PLEO|nr:Metallo-dependent hydrolase [Amniculicola lignicola CBS 123094]